MKRPQYRSDWQKNQLNEKDFSIKDLFFNSNWMMIIVAFLIAIILLFKFVIADKNQGDPRNVVYSEFKGTLFLDDAIGEKIFKVNEEILLNVDSSYPKKGIRRYLYPMYLSKGLTYEPITYNPISTLKNNSETLTSLSNKNGLSIFQIGTNEDPNLPQGLNKIEFRYETSSLQVTNEKSVEIVRWPVFLNFETKNFEYAIVFPASSRSENVRVRAFLTAIENLGKPEIIGFEKSVVIHPPEKGKITAITNLTNLSNSDVVLFDIQYF